MGLDEPFMRQIPESLPDEVATEEPEMVEHYKKFLWELKNMQASRQAMLDDFGMVIPLQEIGTMYRLPLLIDFILGTCTPARINFERIWIRFLQNQMDEQRKVAVQQMQEQARRAKAQHLHIPGQGVHEVLPEPEVDPNA